MGINTSYNLIQKKDYFDTKKISKAFIENYNKRYTFRKKGYLTYEEWGKNKKLFCIGITPIIYNDEEKENKLWYIITFSDPKKSKSLLLVISGILKTRIEIIEVYDTSGYYIRTVYQNNEMVGERFSGEHGEENREFGEDTILSEDYSLPYDYYALKKYSLRKGNRKDNDRKEEFLIFENKTKCYYAEPYNYDKSYNIEDDDIPF